MNCALRDSFLVVVELHGVALGTKVCGTKDLSSLLGFKGWKQHARRMVHRQPRLLHLERRHSRSQLRQSGRSEAPRILHHHQPHRLARSPTSTNSKVLDLGKCLNLRGPLDDKLRDMANLEYLDLRSNTLTGAIPASVGTLKKVRCLHLGVNTFSTGAFCCSGQRGQAYSAWLSIATGLAGSVPNPLSKLTSHEYLYNTS